MKQIENQPEGKKGQTALENQQPKSMKNILGTNYGDHYYRY